MTALEMSLCAVSFNGLIVLPQILTDPLRKYTQAHLKCSRDREGGACLVERQCSECKYWYPSASVTEDSNTTHMCPICIRMHGDYMDRMFRSKDLVCARGVLITL